MEKTPLVFIDKNVTINGKGYREYVLERVLQPWAEQHFGKQRWTFQQDSAPAHREKLTQEWLEKNVSDFIRWTQWPASSPDLNPLDFSIWDLLEEKACSKTHKSIESLKSALVRAWDKISDDTLSSVVENWRKRLQLCVRANGGYFENF